MNSLISHLFDEVSHDTSAAVQSIDCPSLVMGASGWTRYPAGRVEVPMILFESKADASANEGWLEYRLRQGLSDAFGDEVPLGKVGTLYVRTPWTSDGARSWARYGAIILVRR